VFAPLSDENKNKKYQEEVPVYVSKWMPFKELMIMLQASLQEIGDRCVCVFYRGPFCTWSRRRAGTTGGSCPSPHCTCESVCVCVCVCVFPSFFLKIYLFYVYGNFVCMYVCVPHVCLVPIETRRVCLIPLELELQMVMSCHVGSGR
jgi:hypothetical protein